METVDLPLLLGIGCPGFTPLREDADYVCVHRSGQLGVLLNAGGQSSQGCCGLANPFVDFGI